MLAVVGSLRSSSLNRELAEVASAMVAASINPAASMDVAMFMSCPLRRTSRLACPVP